MSKNQHSTIAKKLKPLLDKEDFAGIETLINEVGLNEFLSDEHIKYYRVLGDESASLFLLTLAVNNKKLSKKNNWLMTAYEVLVTGRASNEDKNSEMIEALAICIKNKSIEDSLINKILNVVNEEILLAIEFCLDNECADFAEKIIKKYLINKNKPEDLLNLTNLLLGRSSRFITKPRSDWSSWATSFGHLTDALSRLKLNKAASSVSLVAAECSFAAKDYQASLIWCKKIDFPDDLIAANLQIAKSQAHLDNHVESIYAYDKCLNSIINKSDKWILSKFDTAKEAVKKKEFNTGSAAIALHDLQTILNALKIKAFLVSGTLLGYVRNGGFLTHDKDIDVGILDWKEQFTIFDALNRSSIFYVQFKYLNKLKVHHVPIIHLKTGISIDIFIYHPEGDKVVTGVHGSLGYDQYFAFTPFELEEVKFLDINFYIPKNYDLNLAENFGAWQISDPHYISHLESPSTVDVGGLIYMLVARQEIIRSILEKKKIKLNKALRIMEAMQNKEYVISNDLIKKIENRFGV